MMGKRLDRSEELLIDAFDHADEEEFAKIVAVTEGLDLPVKHSEQMAWSVIDKAELYDEAEKKRREEFKAWLLKRRIRNTCIGVGITAILLIALYIAGVFDTFLLKKYAYEVYRVDAYSRYGVEYDMAHYPTDVVVSWGQDAREKLSKIPLSELAAGTEIKYGGSPLQAVDEKELPSDFKGADEKTLENTVYDALEAYCSEKDLALDDYFIMERQLCKVQGTENGYVLLVRYIGTCLDTKASDQGETWKSGYDEGLPELAANMSYIRSVIMVEL